MAHDILGTFNRAQFDRFATFAQGQLALAEGRIQHLQAEIDRIGTVTFSFDEGGVPLGYTATADSYIGRLMALYEILGGDALHDLQIRSMTQPVFLMRADESTNPQILSNGEIMGMPGLADAPSAELMQASRSWLLDTFQYRRDSVERKIRRMMDYSDQLQAEVNLLFRITRDQSVAGSLANLFQDITDLIEDRSYRAVTKDEDAFGKKAYAPFAGYMPGPDGAEAEDYSRTLDGTSVPGSKGGKTT